MRTSAKRAGRLAITALAFALLPGHVQIRDEATIRGSGSAVAKRTVTVTGADDLDQVIELVPETMPGEKQRRKMELAELRAKICEGLTKRPESWELCRWDDNTLVVEKSWSSRESPFSSAENGTATFALHHWLGNPITRPPFPLIGVGPVMRDDDEHRAFIRGLQEKGFVLELKVDMPGEIRMLWGKNVKDGQRSVTIDLLQPWPEERSETFIMSEAGILHSPVFHFAVLIALSVAGLIWMRRAKRAAAGF